MSMSDLCSMLYSHPFPKGMTSICLYGHKQLCYRLKTLSSALQKASWCNRPLKGQLMQLAMKALGVFLEFRMQTGHPQQLSTNHFPNGWNSNDAHSIWVLFIPKSMWWQTNEHEWVWRGFITNLFSEFECVQVSFFYFFLMRAALLFILASFRLHLVCFIWTPSIVSTILKFKILIF